MYAYKYVCDHVLHTYINVYIGLLALGFLLFFFFFLWADVVSQRILCTPCQVAGIFMFSFLSCFTYFFFGIWLCFCCRFRYCRLFFLLRCFWFSHFAFVLNIRRDCVSVCVCIYVYIYMHCIRLTYIYRITPLNFRTKCSFIECAENPSRCSREYLSNVCAYMYFQSWSKYRCTYIYLCVYIFK